MKTLKTERDQHSKILQKNAVSSYHEACDIWLQCVQPYVTYAWSLKKLKNVPKATICRRTSIADVDIQQSIRYLNSNSRHLFVLILYFHSVAM